MSENLIELSAFAGRPETDQSGRASSVNYREKVRCIRQYITMAHGSPGKQPKTVALYVRHHCRRRRHSSHRISPPIRLSSSRLTRKRRAAQKAAQVDAARCLTRMRHPITPSELILHRHQDGMIRTKQMLRWNLQKNNACPAPASDYKKNIRRATGARAGHLVQVFQFKGASETNA